MRRPRPCLAALALFGLATPLHAGTITQTQDFRRNVRFDLFDPSLGTLETVTFFVNASVTFTFGVTPTPASPVTVPGTGTAGIGLALPSGNTATATGSQTRAVKLDPSIITYQFVVANVYSGGSGYVDPLVASYVGLGFFATPMTAVSADLTFDQFTANNLIILTVAGRVTLEYDYAEATAPPPAAVPEPASIGMALAACLIILAWKGRS